MKINRTATIVQFRAIYDVTDAGELDRLAHEVMAAKGAVLGTTGDGCDVVAAFPNARYAAAFLTSNGIEAATRTRIGPNLNPISIAFDVVVAE
jgi:hypothetical protein